MDEKIKRLASKVEGLVNYFGTPQDTYDDLVKVARKQSDYFTYLGPENFIKLSIYIYSFKETNGFELGEKWINNLAFAELVVTQQDPYIYACNYCGGDGKYDCDNCDGIGIIPCTTCDGDGTEIDDEGDDVTCDSCDGDGEVTCNYCDGARQIDCENCNGQGEITSEDEVLYSKYTIVTWNKEIKDACELKEDENEPAISEYTFDSLRNDYIVLFLDDNEHGPLNIIEDEMYCIYYGDEPYLGFTPSMKVDIRLKKNYVNHLYN